MNCCSHHNTPVSGGPTVYRTTPAGGWEPAEPLGWMEEHGRVARMILFLLGRGHCGKRGWRTGVGY